MKARNYILIVVFSLTLNFKCFGTQQVSDILIYKGDTLSIYSNPLEGFSEIASIHHKLFGEQEGCLTTACWRQYQAEWTVLKDQLYLTNIYSCCFKHDQIKANLKELFRENCIDGKVEANWVTGNLTTPTGKYLFYVYSDYYDVHEGQTELIFKDGKIIDTKNYDNSKSRQSEFSQDNERLFNHIYNQINWDSLPYQNNKVKVYVQFSANEDGIIDSAKVIRGFNETFNNETIRVVKFIPEWDVFYRRGQHQRRAWILPIVFSEENKQRYSKN